ncbi:MAG: FeoB-associated Cys-rich membrane protein [Desulfococcaceae bacterium]
METAVVAVIVGIAVIYTAKIFYRSTKKKGACGCGCSSCPFPEACGERGMDGGQSLNETENL